MNFASFNLSHPPHIPGLMIFTFGYITRDVKFEQYQMQFDQFPQLF